MSQTRMQALQNIGTALADASSAATTTTQMSGMSTGAATCTTKSTRPQFMAAGARVDIATTRPFTANTSEGDKAHYVHVEVPGLSAGDLSVSVESDRVVVKSDSRDWRTAFSIPDGVERDKISANFNDGLLRIVMPKTADTARREIPVRSGDDGTPADG
ncbi:MAG: Hsp20/alpha crystallin family protein [Burkholderiales bacterium]